MSSRKTQKQANRVVREQLARETRRRRLLLISAAAVAVVVVAGLVGLVVSQSQSAVAGYSTPAHATADHTGIVTSPGGPTVAVYLDYLCPNCKKFEAGAGPTLSQWAADKKITLVYQPIAILNDSTEPTGYSTRAGAAAACAADGNKFVEYTAALYAAQPGEGSAGLDDDTLVKTGTGVGLGATFESCVRAGKYTSWMKHNTDESSRKNVNGTPTVMVNGKVVETSIDAIKKAANIS